MTKPTRFEVGHKDGLVVMNVHGTDEVADCHFTWTPEQARVIAEQLVHAAADVDERTLDGGAHLSDHPSPAGGRTSRLQIVKPAKSRT